MRSASGAGCTTLRHKTHGTEAGDEVAVAYAWHPWAGRLVHVHEVIERTTGASARCSLVEAPAARVQEIPVWMLDAALCRSMRASDGPVAALPALRTLRSLLSEAMTRTSAVSSPDPQIASPDYHRGDRHAPPALPASERRTTNSTSSHRPQHQRCFRCRGGTTCRSRHGKQSPADEPPVGRPRRRRRAAAGERRR